MLPENSSNAFFIMMFSFFSWLLLDEEADTFLWNMSLLDFFLLSSDSLPILLMMKFFISFQSLIYPKVMENNMISHVVPLLANLSKVQTRQSVNPNWHQPSHPQRAREVFQKTILQQFFVNAQTKKP